MAYRESYGGFGGFSLTPWVKRLLIANTAVYLVVVIVGLFLPIGGLVRDYLAFAPRQFITRPWTVLTYAFVHAGILHLLGNMLTLFFFGPPLEERWGSRDFLKFYGVAAVGGALLSALLYFLDPAAFIVGASAATLGVMLGFAMIWPDMPIHIWGIFPVKAKWLVAGLALINLLMAVEGSGGGVAVLAHLGGMAAAFLYLKSPWGPRGWGETAPVVKKRKPALAAWKAGKPAPSAAATAAPEARRERRAERDLLDEVDRILDKISTQGMQSLTEQERERLHELSRQRRTN